MIFSGTIIQVVLLFLFSCENNSIPKRHYAYKSIQNPNFDSYDVDQLMKSKKNVISEIQLDSLIHGKKSTEDTIYFSNLNESLYSFRYEIREDDFVTYQTKDSIKLVVVSQTAIDNCYIYILKDAKFKKLIQSLIKHQHFILNKLTQPMPDYIIIE